MNRSSFLLLCLALSTACSKDADNDGFDSKADCDDNDPAVNPDAVELCDAVDNDCDGETDEGVLETYFRDLDGDGYGDEASRDEFCGQPPDYVALSGDCNDTDSDFNPGASETDCGDPNDYNCDGSVGYADVDGDGLPACQDCNDGDADIFFGANEQCDGKDNDCDGEVDDNPVDGTTFYIDHDGDGYGAPSALYAVYSCGDAPSGYVEDNTDCNDLAATAYPGADEVCDGIDNDCNDLVDVDDDNVLDAGFFYPDSDGDGFGEEDALTKACVDLDGFIEVGGDCDDTREEVNPDQTEVCNNGLDDDCAEVVTCTLDLASADSTWTGSDADDKLGSALSGAGDLNQDGFDDFLIGAEAADADGDGADEGAVYVVFGPVTGGGVTTSVDDAGLVLTGGDENGRFGLDVAGLGDVNGDGIDDFASGASNHSEHETLSRTANGAVWVFYGAEDLETSGLDGVDDAGVWFYGDRSYDWMGGLVSGAGDVNGDGKADIVLGSTGDDDGGSQSGAFYVMFGGAAMADRSVADADVLLHGDSSNDRVGSNASGVGDIDNDGIDDLVMGTPYVAENGSNAGGAYIALGPLDSGTVAGVSSTDAVIYGGSAGDLAGASISAAGDMDGDGYADFYVGATGDNTLGGAGSGAVFLVSGSATIVSDYDASDLDSSYTALVYGSGADDALGGAVAGGEDFNGDGSFDLVVGGSAAGSQGEGRSYVLYGPVSGSVDVEANAIAIFEGVDVDDGAGSEVALLGDLDGSGVSAIGVASTSANQSATDAGSAYVVSSIGL
jgi:hypothetical protein